VLSEEIGHKYLNTIL